MIHFNCDQCGKSYEVSDTKAGQKGPCRQCGRRITVPSPTPPDESNPFSDPGPPIQQIAKSGNEITKVLLNISLILLKVIVKLTLSVISKLTMRAVRLITMIVGGIIGGLLGGIGLAVATEGKSEFIEDIGELLGANRLFGITGAIDNMADFTGKLFVTIGVTNTNPADEMGGFVVGFLIGAYFGIGIGPFMAKFNEELILLVKTTWGVFWDEFNTDEIVAEERKDGVVVVRRKSGGGMVLLGMLFFMVFLWIPKLCIISFFCPLIAIYRLVFDS